jgi:hypothetical protein
MTGLDKDPVSGHKKRAKVGGTDEESSVEEVEIHSFVDQTPKDPKINSQTSKDNFGIEKSQGLKKIEEIEDS